MTVRMNFFQSSRRLFLFIFILSIVCLIRLSVPRSRDDFLNVQPDNRLTLAISNYDDVDPPEYDDDSDSEEESSPTDFILSPILLESTKSRRSCEWGGLLTNLGCICPIWTHGYRCQRLMICRDTQKTMLSRIATRQFDATSEFVITDSSSELDSHHSQLLKDLHISRHTDGIFRMPFVGKRKWHPRLKSGLSRENWAKVMESARMAVVWRDGGELRVPLKMMNHSQEVEEVDNESGGEMHVDDEERRLMLKWLRRKRTYEIWEDGIGVEKEDESKASDNGSAKAPPALCSKGRRRRWDVFTASQQRPISVGLDSRSRKGWTWRWPFSKQKKAMQNQMDVEIDEPYWSLDSQDMARAFARPLTVIETIMVESGPWNSRNIQTLLREIIGVSLYFDGFAHHRKSLHRRNTIDSSKASNVSTKKLRLKRRNITTVAVPQNPAPTPLPVPTLPPSKPPFCARDHSTAKIVFVILVHENDTSPWRQAGRPWLTMLDALMGVIHHHDHYYAIHVDRGASDEFYGGVVGMAKKYNDKKIGRKRAKAKNILVVPREASVAGKWGSASLVWTEMVTWSYVFREEGWDFDYLINLSGGDVPLTSVGNLTKIITGSFPPFTSFMHHTRSNIAERLTYIYNDDLYLLTNLKTSNLIYTHRKLLSPPTPLSRPALTLARGKQWYIMHVSLARRILTHPNLLQLLFATQYVMIPDEMFWGTAAYNLGTSLDKVPRHQWGLIWEAWDCRASLAREIEKELSQTGAVEQWRRKKAMLRLLREEEKKAAMEAERKRIEALCRLNATLCDVVEVDANGTVVIADKGISGINGTERGEDLDGMGAAGRRNPMMLRVALPANFTTNITLSDPRLAPEPIPFNPSGPLPFRTNPYNLRSPLWIHNHNLRFANFTPQGVVLNELGGIRRIETLKRAVEMARMFSLADTTEKLEQATDAWKNETRTAGVAATPGAGGFPWGKGDVPGWGLADLLLFGRKSPSAGITCRVGYLAVHGTGEREKERAKEACVVYG